MIRTIPSELDKLISGKKTAELLVLDREEAKLINIGETIILYSDEFAQAGQVFRVEKEIRRMSGPLEHAIIQNPKIISDAKYWHMYDADGNIKSTTTRINGEDKLVFITDKANENKLKCMTYKDKMVAITKYGEFYKKCDKLEILPNGYWTCNNHEYYIMYLTPLPEIIHSYKFREVAKQVFDLFNDIAESNQLEVIVLHELLKKEHIRSTIKRGSNGYGTSPYYWLKVDSIYYDITVKLHDSFERTGAELILDGPEPCKKVDELFDIYMMGGIVAILDLVPPTVKQFLIAADLHVPAVKDNYICLTEDFNTGEYCVETYYVKWGEHFKEPCLSRVVLLYACKDPYKIARAFKEHPEYYKLPLASIISTITNLADAN